MSNELEITEQTRLRRNYKRGSFDAAAIHAVLDAMPLCHVGYVVNGRPAVTPTLQWREGERVYWHGSSASRALKTSTDHDVCLTVTLLDGMVIARSAFNHSANFRSVMIFGKAEKVTGQDEKDARLKALVEAYYPGRWDLLRPISTKETKATTILSMPITEASAKVRTGGSVDDEEDYALPIWAGTIPISMQVGAPVDDPRNLPGLARPEHITNYKL